MASIKVGQIISCKSSSCKEKCSCQIGDSFFVSERSFNTGRVFKAILPVMVVKLDVPTGKRNKGDVQVVDKNANVGWISLSSLKRIVRVINKFSPTPKASFSAGIGTNMLNYSSIRIGSSSPIGYNRF